jgi:hypothetical protein
VFVLISNFAKNGFISIRVAQFNTSTIFISIELFAISKTLSVKSLIVAGRLAGLLVNMTLCHKTFF